MDGEPGTPELGAMEPARIRDGVPKTRDGVREGVPGVCLETVARLVTDLLAGFVVVVVVIGLDACFSEGVAVFSRFLLRAAVS